MPSSKNASIGTCPCPFKGCEELTAVFKFRGRSDNPARHRYAGRLYCQCPTHGRVESQEWILENATIETTAASSEAPVASSSGGAVATDRGSVPAKAPTPAPAPIAPVKRSVTTTPAAAARSRPATPAQERALERWGFFE